MVQSARTYKEALDGVRATVRKNLSRSRSWQISTGLAAELLSREGGNMQTCERLLNVVRSMREHGALMPEVEDLDFFMVSCPVLRVVAERLHPERPSLKGADLQTIVAAFREFNEHDLANFCLRRPAEFVRRFHRGRQQLTANLLGRRPLGPAGVLVRA